MSDSQLPSSQQDIINILTNHYPTPSSSTSSTTTNTAIKNAAKELSTLTASAYTISSHPNIIWLTLQAIQAFAVQTPQGLDFALHVYAETIKAYPAHVTSEYGSGPTAGKQELRFWLVDFADSFNSVYAPPATMPGGPVGKSRWDDGANLIFTHDEVENRLDAVLSRVDDWRAERNQFIINSALLGRCFAFNFFRGRATDLAKRVEMWMTMWLTRIEHWTRADFIGACVLLRACARSLVEELEDGDERVQRWRTEIASFLSTEKSLEADEDFVLKSHSALVLKNLRDGPFDETSEQLFNTKNWVY